MRSFSFEYSSGDDFRNIVLPLDKTQNYIVKIYYNKNCKTKPLEIAKQIKSMFSNAQIVGLTADFVVFNGGFSSDKTNIVFIETKNVEIHKQFFLFSDDLLSIEDKVGLAFLYSSYDNPAISDALNKLEAISSKTKVFGGIQTEGENYLFDESGIYENATFLLWSSDKTYINSFVINTGEIIGATHFISKTNGKEILEIDGIPALDFYESKVGKSLYTNIGLIGAYFPITIKIRDVLKLLPITAYSVERKSIFVVEELKVGQPIRLSYGNKEIIRKNILDTYKSLGNSSVQTCSVFLGKTKKKTISDFKYYHIQSKTRQNLINGCCFDKKIYRDKGYNLYLYDSIIAVFTSEEQSSPEQLDISDFSFFDESSALEASLYNLIKASDDEICRKNELLYDSLEETMIELKSQKMVDESTKLFNRNKLFEDMNTYGYDKLALIKINNYEINYYYSKLQKASFYQAISSFFEKYFSGQNIVYKLDGPIFAVAAGCLMKEEVFINQLKLLENYILRNTLLIDGISYQVNTSIAVCLEKESLMEKAILVLNYIDKKDIHYMVYDKNKVFEYNVGVSIDITKKIKHAINNNGIIPYFQGIIDNRTKKIIKYEALVRLIDEDKTVYLPSQFLPIAKESGLYEEVQFIMINKIFDKIDETNKEISLNLLYSDILNPKLNALVFSRLKSSKYPKCCVFEILETQQITDYSEVEVFIEKVHSFGGKIAIDDFGNGYSNLTRFIDLKLDYIKLDGSIIRDINTKETAKYIVEAVVGFAQKINVQTIAEYVWSKDVFDTISKIGINYSQGFYFSKPDKDIC